MVSTLFNSASDVRSSPAAETLVKNWWLFTLRGILGIIFGFLALIFPGPTMLSLVLLFSAYMLVDGVAAIISAVRAIRRKEDRWGILIFEGLLNIATGIAAFLWPYRHSVRVADCRMGDCHGRPDDGRRLPFEYRPWPVVVGSGRVIVSCLWCAPDHRAFDRRRCAHMVDRSLRARLRHRIGYVLLQAAVAAARAGQSLRGRTNRLGRNR
jgi:Short repeat of unknown function (DUF308)